MLILKILGVIFFTLLLIKGTDWTIVAIRRLSKSLHLSGFAISALLVALGTSLPELFVGIAAGVDGQPGLSLGNIVGSNIANIAVIAGISAVFFGKIRGQGEYLRREIILSFLAGLAPFFLLLDGYLSRVDAFILLGLYGFYASSLFKKQYESVAQVSNGSFFYRFIRKVKDTEKRLIRKDMGYLFLGIATLLFSADMVVKLGGEVAESMGISVLLIGVFLVALGTSLPELAFSLKTISKRKPSMFFGNLLGSTIANSTLIIGITVVIAPLKVESFSEYFYSVVFFILIYLLFWFFVGTKKHLTRAEGVLMLLIYTVFVILEFGSFIPF